jgi:hypothetical protein
MTNTLNDVLETLELILEEDMSSKIRIEIERIVQTLKKNSSSEILMKIQDEIEAISHSSQLDDYVRNELINLGPLIESIYNS